MTSTAAQEEFNELMRDKDVDRGHPEDRDHDSDRSEPDSPGRDNDYYEKIDPEDLPDDDDPHRAMRANYYLPNIRSEANTGPKGVIADAHAFEQAKRQARFAWRKQSPPPSAFHRDEKFDSDDEDSDDSFMKQWRQARLRELQNAGQRVRSRTTSPSRRIYGTFEAVDGEGYLEAIEKVARDVVVVVYIYDDMSDISNLIEHHMRQVASKNDHVRFVKLHCEEAEMEGAGVPAVLAYKGGDKFAGLVPLIDEIPADSDLSVLSLETVFRRHRIL